MFYESVKAIVRSLRFRLMAWNTGVVLLMVIPTLVAVRMGLRRSLFSEFDNVLLEDLQEIRLAVKQFSHEWPRLTRFLERKALGHKHSNWFVRLVRPDGQVLFATANAPDLDRVAENELGIVNWEGTDFRVVQGPLDQAGLPAMQIQTGASFSGVHAHIDLLTRMMLLAGTLLLILAPLVGFWLAGRATAPIAQIIHTTGRLRPTHLDERLPLRQSGDELDQLSQTINGLLDRVGSFVQEKHDFLANAAHELRSPLAAIRGSVEVALNSERRPEEYVALLEDIMEECGNLGTLVNQLLLLSEGEQEPEFAKSGQKTALDKVVSRAVNMFEGAAEAEGLKLRISRLDPALILGDAHHLQQVINNLLDNALKFTPAPGEVRVEVRTDPARDCVVLEVSDTGVGIPAEELPRIFERFYRGDHSRQRQGARRGSGLGLSICQAIVQSLHGQISVQSQPGSGSTFRVTLPRASEVRSQGSGVRSQKDPSS